MRKYVKIKKNVARIFIERLNNFHLSVAYFFGDVDELKSRIFGLLLAYYSAARQCDRNVQPFAEISTNDSTTCNRMCLLLCCIARVLVVDFSILAYVKHVFRLAAMILCQPA